MIRSKIKKKLPCISKAVIKNLPPKFKNSLHNIVGHPLMEVLTWMGKHDLAETVHRETIEGLPPMEELMRIILEQNGIFLEKIIQKPVVYVAGPYRSYVHDEKSYKEYNNMLYASLTGTNLSQEGLAPLVPHPSIHQGVYGRDAIKEERESGILSTLALLIQIALGRKNKIFIMKKKDGTLSQGTQIELELWTIIRKAYNYPLNVIGEDL